MNPLDARNLHVMDKRNYNQSYYKLKSGEISIQKKGYYQSKREEIKNKNLERYYRTKEDNDKNLEMKKKATERYKKKQEANWLFRIKV